MAVVVPFDRKPRSRWAQGHLDFIETTAQQLRECLEAMSPAEFDAEIAALRAILAVQGLTPARELLGTLYHREEEVRLGIRKAR